MARFDVHLLSNGGGMVVGCQADILAHLTTRFVVPLIPVDAAPLPGSRLNPVFQFSGESHAFVTQYASTVMTREIGPAVGSLAHRESALLNALDMLISGF